MTHKDAGKKFQQKLEKLNDYLADNKWISAYYADTTVVDDELINFKSTKPDYTIKFKPLSNGLLKAIEIEKEDGEINREVYIGSVQPRSGTFELRGVETGDIVNGIIDFKNNSLSIQEFRPEELGFEINYLIAASSL